jgi:hypothetical protein
MSEKAKSHLKPSSLAFSPASNGILQRKCACGNHTLAGGEECAECAKKKTGLQRKIIIGASNDPLEQEADRVADRVMTASAHSAVTGTPLHIQRATGQAAGQMDAVPASINNVLASSGKPLEPTLRRDMEQRFGYDFSRVRVHSGADADQSAREVDANAYTVGHDIIFGAGRFAPSTHEGRGLIAHELTHVVQQSDADGIRVGQSNEKHGLSPITVQRAPANRENRSEHRHGSTLPYREAKNLTDCLRIMGPESGEYCRREVLGEDVPDASLPTAPSGTSTTRKSARINALDQRRGCAYTITYSNLREVNCDTAWKNKNGTNPPGPLCGVSLVYDITSVNASGSKCPKLDGLKVSEVVKGDHGCTPPDFVWAAGPGCTIGPGGKVTACTDIFTVCGLTSDLKGDCTEIVDQEIEVGGQLAEEHEIIFDLKKSGKDCKGKVTRT